MSSPTIPSLERCPNCLQPLSKHRPWCKDVKAREPAHVGEVIDHPILGHVPIISMYSRKQAIEDGVLVDCSQEPLDELNRNVGLKFDVAMTATAFTRYVTVPEIYKGFQDLKGRYWDVVWMFRMAVRRESCGHELLFKFNCIPNGFGYQENEQRGISPDHRLVQLKAISTRGDRGEPCLTFMLPSED